MKPDGEFWDSKAVEIDLKWGEWKDDYHAIGNIIKKHSIRTVLDLGCGSGRLFPLFLDSHVKATGVDISIKALEAAHAKFPYILTYWTSLQDMVRFGVGNHSKYDLAVSSRTMQHIPKKDIEGVINDVCHSARLVYINELSALDDVDENGMMFRHDYRKLFGENGFELSETGRIGKQRWLLFRKAVR